MRVLSVVLLVLVGMLLMFIIMTKCYVEIPTRADTIDTLMVRHIRDIRGYKYTIDSLRRVGVVPVMIPARVDTIEIYNVEYRIPVIPYHFRDSIPVSINDVRHYVPFSLMIDGYVGEYSIATTSKNFYTGVAHRKINWKIIGLGAVGVGVVSLIVMLLAR